MVAIWAWFRLAVLAGLWIPAFAGMTGGRMGEGIHWMCAAGLVRAAVRYLSAASSGMERSMNLLGSASAVFAEAASTMRS